MRNLLPFCYAGLLCILSLNSCKNNSKSGEIAANWDFAQQYYQEQIQLTAYYLDSLALQSSSTEKRKEYFINARRAFKKAEPYASYLNPEVGHRTNGPALPVFIEDTERVLEPLGLQKIEESIYEGGVDEAVFQRELKLTHGLVDVLKKNITNRTINAQRFFIATHQQLLRIISFSMAGFDTPVSGLGLTEAAISLRSLYDVYHGSLKALIKEKNPKLDEVFSKQIEQAIDFIGENPDFENFDRFTFIRDYINPVMRSWVAIRKKSALWDGVDNKPFNFDAPTFFEKNSFNVAYFTPAVNRNPSKAQIALGKRLFFDPNLSANGKMACATCHVPAKAYADGKVTNLNNLGKDLKRNTPTLLNSVFQKGFFWDGRSGNLQDQISGVFTNENEFDTAIHDFSDEILSDSGYEKAFKQVFGNTKHTNIEVIRAISSYIATLNSFDSKFDQNIRGEVATYTEQEKQGFNLFMGKALCATCHFIPLTSGTVPPFYTATEREVIGVPETAANKQLDDDLGFYWRYGKEIQRGMFKTPGIRNAGLTAPYMHNGVYQNLEQVIDFYNKGGGAGLGFDLAEQTLPFNDLSLTQVEQDALIAFIESLSSIPES